MILCDDFCTPADSTQASPTVRKKEKFQLNYFLGAINTGRSSHLHSVQAWSVSEQVGQ